MIMRKFAFVSIILSVFVITSAVPGDSPQVRYIAAYSSIAVSEMYRSGVPASITLAQGLLESRYGLSSLATEGNNHFGIKCHDWTGAKMYYDDDKKGECFRKYPSPDQSFKDHSDFLRYRDRYKFLFDYKTTDYKAWAYGLKKAGYATDPAYPSKLIKLIEDYQLYDYDTMTLEEAGSQHTFEPDNSSADVRKMTKAEKRQLKKAQRRAGKHKSGVPEEVRDVIPASPLSIEAPKALEQGQIEEFRFSLSRQMYSKNGVPFVYSIEGETYASIASSYHLFVKELLRFNDLDATEELLPGTLVYLQPKKTKAAKGLDKYIVGEDEEDLRDISQRFGVKESSILKLNKFTSDFVPQEGDTILLR